ncbi:Rho-related GTP-binding protein RhoA-A [Dictyocoela muelleri]|nr:Rho-related GTP-binding protein RhoA-A [Dictyocoela muelleri]
MENNKINASGKVVVVGDGACGKTCLLEVFRRGKFPDEYIPTVVDNFVKEVELSEENRVLLTMWDTAGQEDYDSVRPLSYKDTDLILLCYSIENKELLENVTKKWTLEIGNYCSNTDIFLIGLKKDVRGCEDYDQECVITAEEGMETAKEIKAVKFYECSSKTGENVNVVFEEVANYILEKKKRAPKKKWFFCC